MARSGEAWQREVASGGEAWWREAASNGEDWWREVAGGDGDCRREVAGGRGGRRREANGGGEVVRGRPGREWCRGLVVGGDRGSGAVGGWTRQRASRERMGEGAREGLDWVRSYPMRLPSDFREPVAQNKFSRMPSGEKIRCVRKFGANQRGKVLVNFSECDL